MTNQYYSQRFRTDSRGRRVGTVPIGTIVYIQDHARPLSGIDRAVSREPWIVEAWLNRDFPRWDSQSSRYESVMMAGGHLAQVRSLRSGRVTRVADWILLRCLDAGLERI